MNDNDLGTYINDVSSSRIRGFFRIDLMDIFGMLRDNYATCFYKFLT